MTIAMRDPAGLRGSGTGWLALGTAGVGIILFAGRAAGYHAPACLLRSETGVPCPACGLTRLSVHLLRGDVGTAVTGDLPGVLLLSTLAVVTALQAAAVLAPGRTFNGAAALRSRLVPVILISALLAHWAWTAATGGLLA